MMVLGQVLIWGLQIELLSLKCETLIFLNTKNTRKK